jgi:hypothetical protein
MMKLWEVFKSGAGEGWTSVGMIMQGMKKYGTETRRGIYHKKQENGRLTGWITSCVRNAF